MSIKLFGDDRWLVQVQKQGIRRTRRGKGGILNAEQAEKLALQSIDDELTIRQAEDLLERNIPIDEEHLTQDPLTTSNPIKFSSLRDYYHERWLKHAKVVQNEITLKRNVHPWNYLLHYLGNYSLIEAGNPKQVNFFIEQMKANGPISFKNRLDGRPWKIRTSELSNSTINKSLQNLKATLYLAYSEGILDRKPRIDLLPQDDATPVLPPTDEEFDRLLEACEHYRAVAPWLPEVVELAADTGMRRGELFSLTWGSIEFDRKAIRVEMQRRGRLVNGVNWKPKHGKFREIPMSPRVTMILTALNENVLHESDDLVIPSRG